MKRKENPSGWLSPELTPADPKPGEKGYLHPEFYRNERGEILDAEGNIYDENLNLVKEAPSEGLLLARKQ